MNYDKSVKNYLPKANYLAKKIDQNSFAKKSSKKLSIIVNGKKIFQSDITQEPKTDSISPENFQRIKNALNNPYKNLDEIQIKLGRETLFYAPREKLLKSVQPSSKLIGISTYLNLPPWGFSTI